jgi:hypothetical protein
MRKPMPDVSCIHCGLPAESLNVVDTKSGTVHEGCLAAFNDANEKSTQEQREKLSIEKELFRILVILIAVGGVTLLITSANYEPSQIQGYGGNQNPFVGIANLGLGVLGIFEIIFYAIAGALLLGIAAIGLFIWRKSPRTMRAIVRIVAIVCVVWAVATIIDSVSAVIDSTSVPEESPPEVLRVNEVNSSWSGPLHDAVPKYSQAHTPGPFTEYHDSGEKAAEGTYDLNGKMDGRWTQWGVSGEVQWEGTFVDGLLDGTFNFPQPGHLRPDESTYHSGQFLNGKVFFLSGQTKFQFDVYFKDGEPHRKEMLAWYDSGELMWRSTKVYLSATSYWQSREYSSFYKSGQKKFEWAPDTNKCWTEAGVELPQFSGERVKCYRVIKGQQY